MPTGIPPELYPSLGGRANGVDNPYRGLNRSAPIPRRIQLRVQSYRGPTRLASTHTAIIQEAGLAVWGPTRRLYIPTWGHASGASMLDVVRAGARRSSMRP